ncbi:peptidoglycan-binding domain-containing protein [Streptomyces fulvoviolaceus]|uniref:peptidoglycan-binding domain-containing protein n=1 Tax=Streptomyces fulvoviolaceus TaxID=285535 RepID=UPI0004C71DF7|nr:peptidoglycan-binding domain-containing protein [Streptomyces fulvoviolaceus]MCT9083742.1 peptidoglycan-binding protein [Streptomyces fulvoviolaceus]
MNLRTTRGRAAAAAVSALAVGGLALSASPASASASSGYVNGSGSYYDDFADEGTLSTASHASSNTTCLWQKILWAEGVKESNGTAFDYEDIDGHFGSNTKYATKKLQKAWGQTQDGIVGKKTFGSADDKWNSSTGAGELEYRSYDSGSSLKRWKLTYHGSAHAFNLYRATSAYDGRYTFYANNAWRPASYNANSCD